MLANRDVADIYLYPDVINRHNNNEVVTLGDLHGNTAKFLYFLVSEGVLDMDERTYSSLISLYKKSGTNGQFSGSDLDSFIELLSNVKINDPCPALRLNGDDLADRGKNDLLTLLVFRKLNESNVQFDVIASNHGVEFLKQYVIGIGNQELGTIYQGDWRSFGSSLYGLRKNIDDGIIAESDVEFIIETNYLPNAKLLDYEINNDNTISIYSHAPINQVKIKMLSILFGVEYAGSTVRDIANTIDKINEKYSEALMDNNKLFSLFHSNPKMFAILDNFINDRYEPGELDRYSDVEIEVPAYNVVNIHGHVGEVVLSSESQMSNWAYVNLDTNLGKDEQRLRQGGYPAYVSLQQDARMTYAPEVSRLGMELSEHAMKGHAHESLLPRRTASGLNIPNKKPPSLPSSLSTTSYIHRQMRRVSVKDKKSTQMETDLTVTGASGSNASNDSDGKSIDSRQDATQGSDLMSDMSIFAKSKDESNKENINNEKEGSVLDSVGQVASDAVNRFMGYFGRK